MTTTEDMIIRCAGMAPNVRRALQRWAMRFAGRLLARIGGAHGPSADLLLSLGSSRGRHTMHGRPPVSREPGPVLGRTPAVRVSRHVLRNDERPTAARTVPLATLYPFGDDDA